MRKPADGLQGPARGLFPRGWGLSDYSGLRSRSAATEDRDGGTSVDRGARVDGRDRPRRPGAGRRSTQPRCRAARGACETGASAARGLAMSAQSTELDAVGVGILWDRLVAIADEIVSALVRTSFSTIVTESYDLTVAVLDADRQLIAQGTYSVPVFMGTAPLTLGHMLERFPPAGLRPGDVIVTNDPWFGTGHVFDINVMRPVFRDGRIVAYVISI